MRELRPVFRGDHGRLRLWALARHPRLMSAVVERGVFSKVGKEPDVPLSQYWLAARVGLFLCSLPLRVRRQPLPLLLERLASSGGLPVAGRALEPGRVAQIVRRVCRLGIFGLPVFPKLCLRQSLALFRFLSRMGHPVEIHFGVRKDGGVLGGHSWVVVHGRTLGEREPADEFRTIYSHATLSSRSAVPGIGEPQLT